MARGTGRAWDALIRRHWKGLWTPAGGREAEEARGALKAFLQAVQEELTFHRRVIDEVRGAQPRPAERDAAEARAARPSTKAFVVTRIPEEREEPAKPVQAAVFLEHREREAIERALGHRFKNPRLLEEALAHPTFIQENPEVGLPSNYRLAFLGDALLGFLIADALHTGFPDADPQGLTERRKRVVSRPALGRTAERIGLGPHLLLGKQLHEGRTNRTILAETLEALVGAVYLDGGPEAARTFVDHTFGDDLAAAAAKTPSEPRRGRLRPRRR